MNKALWTRSHLCSGICILCGKGRMQACNNLSQGNTWGEHIGCGSFGSLLWKPRVSSQIHGLHQQNVWELCSGRSQNHPIPWKRFPYMCKTSSCRTHRRCNTRLNHAHVLKIQAHCLKGIPALVQGNRWAAPPSPPSSLLWSARDSRNYKDSLCSPSIVSVTIPYMGAPKPRWAWKDFALPHQAENTFCLLPWLCWPAEWRVWLAQGGESPQQSWAQRLSAKLSSHPTLPMSSNIPWLGWFTPYFKSDLDEGRGFKKSI